MRPGIMPHMDGCAARQATLWKKLCMCTASPLNIPSSSVPTLSRLTFFRSAALTCRHTSGPQILLQERPAHGQQESEMPQSRFPGDSFIERLLLQTLA